MIVNYLPNHDITLSECDIIVNTVNCVNTMGKGVALSFKTRFGDAVTRPYSIACASRQIRPGTTTLFKLPNGRLWAAMATKDHWRDPSRIEWIETALAELAEKAQACGATSIGIPPPGCGNGQLDWKDVEPKVLKALDLPFLKVLDIFARPSSQQPSRRAISGGRRW